MAERFSDWKFVLLWTTIGINAMLLALFLGRSLVPLQETVPALVPSDNTSHRVEYVLEKVGEKRVEKAEDEILPAGTGSASSGYWIVEQYREYEVHYDKNGRLLYKTPTPHQSFMRYWHEPSPSS